MEPIRNILVAIDFEPASLRALAHATRLAQSAHATLTLMHAPAMPARAYILDTLSKEHVDDICARAKRELELLLKKVEAQSVEARSILRIGVPAEAILEVAAEVGADLIVTGTHGYGGLARMVIGSVSSQVVRRSAIPVVVVHEWHFEDRATAALALTQQLKPFRGEIDLVVALSPNAVPTAAVLSTRLELPLDVLMVEPIYGLRESPIGAVCEDGTHRIDDAAVAAQSLTPKAVDRAREAAFAIAQYRSRWLSDGMAMHADFRSPLMVADTLVSLDVAAVAAQALRRLCASRVLLAVPVCTSDMIAALPPEIDRTISAERTDFEGPNLRVYGNAPDLSNYEAVELLIHAGARRRAATPTELR